MKNARIAAALETAADDVRDMPDGWIRQASLVTALKSDPSLYDEVIGTADAAELVGCSPATISSWKARGHLTPVTPPGEHPGYRVIDVLRCAAATRRRAVGASRGRTTRPVPVVTGRDDDLISTSNAAAWLGVSPAAISTWVARGYLAAAGLDERNRPLYRMGDVGRCAATRMRGAVGRDRLL